MRRVSILLVAEAWKVFVYQVEIYSQCQRSYTLPIPSEPMLINPSTRQTRKGRVNQFPSPYDPIQLQHVPIKEGPKSEQTSDPTTHGQEGKRETKRPGQRLTDGNTGPLLRSSSSSGTDRRRGSDQPRRGRMDGEEGMEETVRERLGHPDRVLPVDRAIAGMRMLGSARDLRTRTGGQRTEE